MARLDEVFDPRGVDRGQQRGEAMPSGYYLASITASDLKKTKAGTGDYFEFELTIASEGYKGRKAWARVNRRNPNPEAQRIGHQEFARLLDAIGMGDVQIKDTAQVHDKMLTIKLTIADGQNGDKVNEVKGFYPKEKAGGQAAPQRPAAAPQQPAWQRSPAAQQQPQQLAQEPAQQGEQQPTQPAAQQPASGAARKPWEKA